MNPARLSSVPAFKINIARRYLQAGEVIAYPTEAVYGLGCDPLNETAVMKLLALKHRPVEKGLILIAANLGQLEPYIELNPVLYERFQQAGDDPVTWVVPVKAWVPFWLTGEHASLAVRVTRHPVARRLCEVFGGPLVSTSANPAGKPSVKDIKKLRKYFTGPEFYIVPGALGGLAKETAIIDAVTGERLR